MQFSVRGIALDEIQAIAWAALTQLNPGSSVSLDALVQATSYPALPLSLALFGLTFKGLVQLTPHLQYMLIALPDSDG